MNNIFILTTQRCGSTWLFDYVRSLDGVNVRAEAVTFENLGLIGSRYPIDITCPDSTDRIDIYPIRFRIKGEPFLSAFLTLRNQIIRLYKNVNIRNGIPNNKTDLSPVAYVEKFHPEFFGFDTRKFLRRIVKNNIKPVWIVAVRDPVESIISHREYQIRNPKWYKSSKGAKALELYERSYRSILELTKRCSCIVVDYSEMVGAPGEAAVRIAQYLRENNCLSSNCDGNLKHPSLARDSKRQNGFVGNESSGTRSLQQKHKTFLRMNAKTIAKCNAMYEEIRNSK